MLATARRCLVLNADHRVLSTWPLSLIGAEEAIRAVCKETVYVIDEWPEAFRSPSTTIRVPKVVALRTFAPIDAAPKFCRRSILLRDRYRCQYCGQQFDAADLTFDHVVPRSDKGQTVWENILTCCVPCNVAKRDRPANYSGRKGAAAALRPLKAPRQPTTAELLRAGLEFLDNDTREQFGSWLYWNVELRA